MLSATATDAYNQPISAQQIVWSVTPSEQAGISSTGTLTAFETGVVEVVATAQGNATRFSVTVTPATGTFTDRIQYGGDDHDTGENIVRDLAGNVYVVGSTAGNLEGQAVKGSSDAFVTGVSPRSVVPDPAGNLFVVGDTGSDSGFADRISAGGTNDIPGTDLFVVRIPADGR